MASAPGKTREPSGHRGADLMLFSVAGVVTGIAILTWAAVQLAGGQTVPGNPFAVPIKLATGDLQWSLAATVWTVLLLAVIIGLVGGGAWWWQQRRTSRTRVDSAQQHLGNGKDIESVTAKAVGSKAKSLGVTEAAMPAEFSSAVGVPLGNTLNGTPVYGSWEDMHLDIWGPRQGKSTSRIIPAICEAPGPVLATENKRGNLDHTRLVREFRDADGLPTRQVWVFDPQSVANEEPWWYWEPAELRHRRDPC
ncbi:hypothetical protein MTX80_23500 (plasmid) [Gordonia amicalis]|nr:hypothetical protein [Gordonia amicalis]UOG23767.1 hypothetical protein MTX80_23500 [Gordonia amicalis]